MTITETIKSLEPLFDKAKKEGLWFFCDYQCLWFTPLELKECLKKGEFVWGAENWSLRNPQEKLKQIENRERAIQQEKKEFLSKLNNYEKTT